MVTGFLAKSGQRVTVMPGAASADQVYRDSWHGCGTLSSRPPSSSCSSRKSSDLGRLIDKLQNHVGHLGSWVTAETSTSSSRSHLSKVFQPSETANARYPQSRLSIFTAKDGFRCRSVSVTLKNLGDQL